MKMQSGVEKANSKTAPNKGAHNQAKDELNQIRVHLTQAMKTMRLMPHKIGDRPIKMQSSWVSFDQSSPLIAGTERRPIRPKVTPKQIKHMEYWLNSALKLNQEERRIVLARAGRIPWRRLEEMDGRSHTTLRKVERKSLEKLVEFLPDGAAILPEDLVG